MHKYNSPFGRQKSPSVRSTLSFYDKGMFVMLIAYETSQSQVGRPAFLLVHCPLVQLFYENRLQTQRLLY